MLVGADCLRLTFKFCRFIVYQRVKTVSYELIKLSKKMSSEKIETIEKNDKNEKEETTEKPSFSSRPIIKERP